MDQAERVTNNFREGHVLRSSIPARAYPHERVVLTLSRRSWVPGGTADIDGERAR